MDKEGIVRRRWAIFSVVALVLALAILAGSFVLVRNHAENTAGPAPAAINGRIISEMNYTDLAEVSPAQLSKHYNVPDGVIADSSLYMSKSSDNASELACFQLTDKSKFPLLQSAINSHLNSKAVGFKSLNPTQYNALKNAVVTQKGKYVLVTVGSNTAADTKMFSDLVK